MQSSKVQTETVLMSARNFKRVEFSKVEIPAIGKTFPVIMGYWNAFIGGIFIPCEECICGKYSMVMVHECPDLICEETPKGEPFRYTSSKGVWCEITQNENMILVEIWV